MTRAPLLLLAALMLAGCTVERAEIRRPPRARSAVSAEDSANVRGTLLTFAGEFERGALIGLERLFDPNVVVFESGRADRGWAAYRDHHLAPEIEALRDRSLELDDLGMRIVGGVAWVTFHYRLTAESAAGPVSARGVGTAVLERRGGLWLITHLHLSGSAPGSGG